MRRLVLSDYSAGLLRLCRRNGRRRAAENFKIGEIRLKQIEAVRSPLPRVHSRESTPSRVWRPVSREGHGYTLSGLHYVESCHRGHRQHPHDNPGMNLRPNGAEKPGGKFSMSSVVRMKPIRLEHQVITRRLCKQVDE